MGRRTNLVEKQIIDRLGEERLNSQGCPMKIIEYNDYRNITVQFQDKYKAKVHTTYQHFINGEVKNPYGKSVYGVGMIGDKYSTSINRKHVREYLCWSCILERCYSDLYKNKHPTYQNAICCEEWLLYENFYEWLHSQENFDKWLNGERWTIDKDIFIKRNKIYSPDTCCLVPQIVNCLFVKCDAARGDLPIGVTYHKATQKYRAEISKYHNGKNISEHIGLYDTIEEAFRAYKKAKESYIKKVAEEEYINNNITKQCYEAMMNYQVEITD